MAARLGAARAMACLRYGHREPERAGGISAGAARPGVATGGGPAGTGAAAHAGAAPAGGRPARRDVDRLLHPVGAGPRPAPVPAGAVRTDPCADADTGRARLPVPARWGSA